MTDTWACSGPLLSPLVSIACSVVCRVQRATMSLVGEVRLAEVSPVQVQDGVLIVSQKDPWVA